MDDIGSDQSESQSRLSWKVWLGERLESKQTHRTVLLLIAIDALCVLTDLSYTFLTPINCEDKSAEHQPEWLEYLSLISLCITTLFLLEIPLDLYAFGPRYFGFGSGIPHAGLHLFDAVIVVGTAVFEIGLRGREREVAGLLVLLRLWRLIKLAGGVAVGVGAYDEEAVRLLNDKEARIIELEQEVEVLKRGDRNRNEYRDEV